MSQKKLQIWLPLLLAAAVFAGMVFGYKLKTNMGSYSPSFFGRQNRTSLEEILELVKSKYVDSVNTDSLGTMAIEQVINGLDPHSVYIPAENVQSVNDELKGSFEGVGIEFLMMDDTVTVFKLLPKGPAEVAGLQVADKIIAANDSIVSGIQANGSRVKKVFRGPKGTTVAIQILRQGKSMKVNVQRGIIPVKSIDAAYMMEPGIAFIRINKFAGNTYEEFMQHMEQLKKEGMQKLILDLRDNGGGLLDDAIQMADEFLDDSKDIVYTEGNAFPRQMYSARRPGLFETGKLVVLMDEGTASASEVLIGALQDWDRATIIGRRSFGKGLVQEQYQLSDGSALRLTISRYFTPIGRSIQKPYQRGGAASYKDEIIHRYENGSLFHNDSANHQGKAFKTKGGRFVYGNGGISPDIFIPADSIEFNLFKNSDLLKNVVEEAGFHYFLINQSRLKTVQEPYALRQLLSVDQSLWSIFKGRLARHDLNADTFSPIQQELLNSYLQAIIAHMLWGKEGYFKMVNFSDKMILRSLEEIKK